MSAERDLVSTIAAAHNHVPPEPAEPAVREDVHDPELDRAIDRLVELYKINPPESDAVVQYLQPPLSADGEDFTAEQHTDREADDNPEPACRACGEPSAARARFCAMCGMPLLGKRSERRGTISGSGSQIPHGPAIRYRSNPYLLAAIVMLLAVISWRSGWDVGLRTGPRRQATLPVAVKTSSEQSKPRLASDPSPPPLNVRGKRARVSRKAAKPRPQTDPQTDDEVVWIRRPTGTR